MDSLQKYCLLYTSIMALYKVGRDHLTGSNAEFDYVRVDLFDKETEGAYPARKFRVAAEISDFAGEGGAVSYTHLDVYKRQT